MAVVLVAAVPAIPILIGIAITIAKTSSQPTTRAGFTPAGQSEASSPRRKVAATARPAGALIALLRRPTEMRRAPGGTVLAGVGTRTEFGSPQSMWVVQEAPGWLGVVSPVAGNGRLGWIPASSASLSRVNWELEVSLSARRLTVIESGAVIQRYTIAVGRPSAPTPTGRFAVTDRLYTNDPTGPYGCCVLALSAKSPHAIQDWSGGDRIAIHSTPDTASIGQAASHGCMRLTLAEGRWLLAHIPLGTPTLISS